MEIPVAENADRRPAVALADASVLAMDGIPLELPVAGVGSRILAVAIDYVVLGILWVVLLAFTIWMMAGVLGLPGGWVVAAVLVVFFLAHWAYFAGWELLNHGRTPGKAAVRLRVVGRQGGTPPRGALLVRNLLRDVDVFTGLPLAVTDPLARRLGDRVAGTLVVHDRVPETDWVLTRTPHGWGGREVALVEAYLGRESELAPERARELGWRIFALVERDAPEFAADARALQDPVHALSRALAVREREAG